MHKTHHCNDTGEKQSREGVDEGVPFLALTVKECTWSIFREIGFAKDKLLIKLLVRTTSHQKFNRLLLKDKSLPSHTQRITAPQSLRISKSTI
jgi:hypothetical protein